MFDQSHVLVLTHPTMHDIMHPGTKTVNRQNHPFSFFFSGSSHDAAMSTSATSTPPPTNPSAKKRKHDQLDPEPPPLPPTGSVLFVALYAQQSPMRNDGVLKYRWAFLLAPDDKPETHGRQYQVRETGPKLDLRDGAGGSKGLGILGLEQQRMRFDGILATHGSEDKEDAHKLSTWGIEIQDMRMQSSGDARVRIQLPRVQDVESFEALIKDAFLESDGTRGIDWNHVVWMKDVWIALVAAGDMLGVGGLKSEAIGWTTVEQTAMEFVKAQESKGRFEARNLTLRVPTWGLLERRSLVP